MRLGCYVMEPERISLEYFVHLSYQSVYLYVYRFTVTS
jgi:hypothetical protein